MKKIGKKSSNFRKRKRKAKRTLDQYKNHNGGQKENHIEKKFRIFLEENGIYFIQEYPIKHTLKNTKKELYKVYDFYITDGVTYSFLVELDGDYFHAKNYQEGTTNRLTYIQKKNLRNDKKKDRIAKEIGIPLIRFFESDIKYRFDDVKETILLLINN